ncbi:MAG: ABC transporter permease [Chloroflexota bacterium]|nr:MAG: ABC transporter permease [Chloroflexota bacterium]
MNITSGEKGSSLDRIGVIFSKETRDNLRDRRSLVSAMVSSLIGPLIIVLLIIILGKTLFADMTEKTLEIPIAGAENAPSLIAFLAQYNVKVVPAPENPEAQVREGNYDVILVIPEEYGEDFLAGRPATVRMVLDSTRQSSIANIERTRSLLNTYTQQMAMLRLMARGIDPAIISPIAIERVDLATPQSQALLFLNMMPYFVVMVVFMGGMYVIIDATAGERERGSLEPLLINPAARWEFVVGKLLASLPFAVFAVIFTLLMFAAAFNLLPLEDFIGFQLSIDVAALVWIFLVSLPMILLASGLQMIIATFTRSFKEAQTYVAFLPLIPALPGMGLAFMPVKPSLWNMMIPTFGQQLVINQLMRGETVNVGLALISAAVTLVIAVALIFVAIRLYHRERIIFGTK